MDNSLISICLPTFNGAKYLHETLHSIESQTNQNIEVIVSDDASSDETLRIVEAFKKQSHFPVHIYHHTPSGIGANWNNCLKHASGTYIKFLFQDDVMEKDCLEKMVQVLEENPEVGLVASKRSFIIEENANNDTTQKWLRNYGDLQKEFKVKDGLYYLTKDTFKAESFFPNPKNKIGEPSVVMFRKTIINEIGFFNESLVQILDCEYWYRILKKHPIAIINKPLVKFRLHQNQATKVNKNQDVNENIIYEQLLYRHYYKLLHPKVRNRLYLKYHPWAKLKKSIKKLFN